MNTGSPIDLLISAYPRAEFGQDTLDLYKMILQDVPEEILRLSILKIISTNAYFPTASEIRRAAAMIMAGLDDAPNAEVAWGEVALKLREGSQLLPQFSHPLIGKVVKQMGWYDLRTSSNQNADRIAFVKAYDGFFKQTLNEYIIPTRVKIMAEQYSRKVQKLLTE